MRIVMTSLAALALAACNQPAEPANDANAVDANMATDANAAATARIQLNETSWEFTENGKAITESIDAGGNYVAWSGAEHIDHGQAVIKDGKACFTSAMDKQGETCWTMSPAEIGQSVETVSDKGEKLTIKRIEYVVAAPMP